MSQGRVVWEYVHKGNGWVAVLLGTLNVVLGFNIAFEKKFDSAFLGVAGIFVGTSGLFVLYLVAQLAMGNFKAKPTPPAPSPADQVPLQQSK